MQATILIQANQTPTHVNWVVTHQSTPPGILQKKKAPFTVGVEQPSTTTCVVLITDFTTAEERLLTCHQCILQLRRFCHQLYIQTLKVMVGAPQQLLLVKSCILVLHRSTGSILSRTVI